MLSALLSLPTIFREDLFLCCFIIPISNPHHADTRKAKSYTYILTLCNEYLVVIRAEIHFTKHFTTVLHACFTAILQL